MEGFVYPLFVVLIERVEVHFCPDVFIVDYRNVSALLSNLLSKDGNEGASDQVFIVLGFEQFALIACSRCKLFVSSDHFACSTLVLLVLLTSLWSFLTP
jgi:hypothetical protein